MSPKVAAKQSKAAKPAMSAEHKAALAVGREESRAVRRYLEALEAHKPKRGRKRTAEGIEARLEQIEDRLAAADPLTRVHLVQERINLQNELANKEEAVDLDALEDEFVASARGYGERKGITYAAWRAAGVDANVLRRAGVPRTRG
jgi:predicted DNA-binding protein